MPSLLYSTLCNPRRIISTALQFRQSRMRWMSSACSSLEDRLEDQFNKYMKCDNVKLLSNFHLYKSNLPVRFDSTKQEHIPLYKLPHWVSDEDMDDMANQLESVCTARRTVKYLSAPGGSGKTSSILPAFLNSAERGNGFTHYFYLTFSNNGRKYFDLIGKVSDDSKVAERQGASFIMECLKKLLYFPGRKGPFEVLCEPCPVSLSEVEDEMTKLLEEIARPDKILFHLDEHRKMCPRKPGDNGAEFSKGAMTALASVGTVMATYTTMPPLPACSSSGVCRYPVGLPCLDIDKTMKAVKELEFPHQISNREHKRMWATLCFRLAMKLKQMGLVYIHGRSNPTTEKLLHEFKERASCNNIMTALNRCNELCNIELKDNPIENANASRILLGLAEDQIDCIERQVPSPVIVNDKVSSGFETLLRMTNPNSDVYSQGQKRMMEVLTNNDYLSQTPLETAYSWSLSCFSEVYKRLHFVNNFHVECKQLLPGRIFKDNDTNNYELNFAENTMYYTKDKPSHPLADMFFLTKVGELVLVDFTGGNNDKVIKKKRRLADWIKQEQHKVESKLYGVVIAPLATGASECTGHVEVVCGSKAINLLGGLAQVYRWLK